MVSSRRVLMAVALVVAFGAVGTAAAATVAQMPAHQPMQSGHMFMQGATLGQLPDGLQAPEAPTPHTGCGSHRWGGW